MYSPGLSNWQVQPQADPWLTRTRPGYVCPLPARNPEDDEPIDVRAHLLGRLNRRQAPEKKAICGFDVPYELDHISVAIEESRWMLALHEDWDGEGSSGYSEDTWNRAVGFLVANAVLIWTMHGQRISRPKIENGPDGSIDILWETPKASLLINVPEAVDEPANYYGHRNGVHEIKGTLDTSAPNYWLLMWLME